MGTFKPSYDAVHDYLGFARGRTVNYAVLPEAYLAVQGGGLVPDSVPAPSPVAEPSSLLLIGAGLASLGLWGRIRRA